MNEDEVELIFLDIEMPEMTGLDLLEALPYMPQIIFTTANKEYAFDAYEYDVTDFLKKPITLSRFLKSIEKARLREEQLTAVARGSAESELYVKTDGRYVRLPYDQVLYFENVGDYVKVVSTLGNFLFHSTIKGLEKRLVNPRFLKVHRSFIVNLNKIKDIEDGTLVISDKVIPISRAHKPVLMKRLNII